MGKRNSLFWFHWDSLLISKHGLNYVHFSLSSSKSQNKCQLCRVCKSYFYLFVILLTFFFFFSSSCGHVDCNSWLPPCHYFNCGSLAFSSWKCYEMLVKELFLCNSSLQRRNSLFWLLRRTKMHTKRVSR